MTELLDMFEDYYGIKYRRFQRSVCAQWLARLPERNHVILFAEVTRIHPGAFKTIPDVCIFEKAMDAVRDRVAEQSQEDARRLTQDRIRLLEEGAMPKDEVSRVLRELPDRLGWLKGIVGNEPAVHNPKE